MQQSSHERQVAAAAVAAVAAVAAAVAAVAVVAAVAAVEFEQNLVSVHRKQLGWASSWVLLEAASLVIASGPAPAVAPAAAQAHAAVGCHLCLRPQL